MKITIYKKLYIGDKYILSDFPVSVYDNVSMVEIRGKYIFGNIDGEQLTIKTDNYNYSYHIE